MAHLRSAEASIRSRLPLVRAMCSPMAGTPGLNYAAPWTRFGVWTLQIVKRSDAAKGFELLAPPLGGRAHLRMARAVPPIGQGLGEIHCLVPRLGSLIAHIRLVTRRLARYCYVA